MKDILIDRSSRPSAKRLSVIIPSFNRVGDLKNALDSLVAQSVKDFDVFVSDDGSTDDNEGLVKSYREKLDITYIANKRSGGPALPRNVAMNASASEWVSFLDSDDTWSVNRIERIRPHLADNIDLVYHCLEVDRRDKSKKIHPKHGSTLGIEVSPRKMQRYMAKTGNPIPMSSVTARRERLLSLGGFVVDTRLNPIDDFAMWYKLAAGGGRIICVNEVLGKYNVHGSNISKDGEGQYMRHKHLFGLHRTEDAAISSQCMDALIDYKLGCIALRNGMPIAATHFKAITLSSSLTIFLKAQARLLQGYLGIFRNSGPTYG